jgi:hypothetical protein
MQFDSADVANMYANGTWTNVILHEIGHILGIGTLQGGRSMDVQADLQQAKDSIQLNAGVLAPDGTRFLIATTQEDSSPMTVILNWRPES